MDLTISEKIKILCKRKGFSLSKVAALMGKSAPNFYQQLERDNFRIEDLKKIAEILHCDLVVDFVEKNDT